MHLVRDKLKSNDIRDEHIEHYSTFLLRYPLKIMFYTGLGVDVFFDFLKQGK